MKGREYGIGKYGRNTYDKWRQTNWTPIPVDPPVEVWVPIINPVDGWAPDSVVPPNEIWIPIDEPAPPAWTPI